MLIAPSLTISAGNALDRLASLHLQREQVLARQR